MNIKYELCTRVCNMVSKDEFCELSSTFHEVLHRNVVE